MRCALFLLLAVSLTTFAEPASQRLAPFVGEFDGVFEEWDHERKVWTRNSILITGRPVVSGHYVELRGRYPFAGFERPVELVLLWSYDPFQKEYRLAVLDDLVGLLDVFEQDQSEPLRVANVHHGTYFAAGEGRRGWSRMTVAFANGRLAHIGVESSSDEGKTWRPNARLILTAR
jgi:hypothetical protein